MSRPIDFNEFCYNYNIAPEADYSKTEYAKYCEVLNVLNNLLSKHVTREALIKASAKDGNASEDDIKGLISALKHEVEAAKETFKMALTLCDQAQGKSGDSIEGRQGTD